MRAILTGIRLIRKIAEQPALKPYIVEELAPGPSVASDADLAEYVRQTGVSNHHPKSGSWMIANLGRIVGFCRNGQSNPKRG
jgi:choline dehydrogenase-like flavoprotein